MRDCVKTRIRDAFIPSPLTTLLLSQNEIRLTWHSLFPVNLYSANHAVSEAFIKLTVQCAATSSRALKVSCLVGNSRALSPFGRQVQYLPFSSPLEVPWPPNIPENITHDTETTLAHPHDVL